MQISLITPVHNSAATIEHCINSVKQQTVPCQHIFVDGASEDGTINMIEKHRDGHSVFVSEPDQGMYDAINKGLAFATGSIIGILNSDDFYANKWVLEKVLRVLENPLIDACYGDLDYVDRNNIHRVTRKWRSSDYRVNRFYNGWMPPHPTFFIRKSWYDKYGRFRLDMGSVGDYELMLRMLLKHGASAEHIPEVLVLMRNAGMSNASFRNRLRANRYDRKAWKVNSLTPRPWTLTAKPLRKLIQWI